MASVQHSTERCCLPYLFALPPLLYFSLYPVQSGCLWAQYRVTTPPSASVQLLQ